MSIGNSIVPLLQQNGKQRQGDHFLSAAAIFIVIFLIVIVILNIKHLKRSVSKIINFILIDIFKRCH